MDTIPRQFLELARKAYGDLTAFLDKQKRQSEAVTEYCEAHKQPTGPRSPLAVVVHSELQIPEKIIQQYKAEQDKAYGLQRRSYWVGLATLIALVVYTIFTGLMYRADRDAADAAKSAAETAKTTLIASNRPWLDVRLAIAGPMIFNKAGMHIPVTVDTVNSGHAPAVQVVSEQEFLNGTTNPVADIKRNCQQADGQSAFAAASNRELSEVIFPSSSQRQQWTLLMNRERLESKIGPSAPVIVWCVSYRADFSNIYHHIGYVWYVGRKNAAAPSGVSGIEWRKGNVPANELILSQNPFIGPLAD
jgi:hypothetical protein